MRTSRLIEGRYAGVAWCETGAAPAGGIRNPAPGWPRTPSAGMTTGREELAAFGQRKCCVQEARPGGFDEDAASGAPQGEPGFNPRHPCLKKQGLTACALWRSAPSREFK